MTAGDRLLVVSERVRVRCPICSRGFEVEFDEEGDKRPTKFFPFCSERCRDVDLGRWIDEEYRVSEPLLPGPETDGVVDDEEP